MEEDLIKAIGRINTVPKGQSFTLKDLITQLEWSQIKGNSLGLEFKAIMEATDDTGKAVYQYLGITMKSNKTQNGNYTTQVYTKI